MVKAVLESALLKAVLKSERKVLSLKSAHHEH